MCSTLSFVHRRKQLNGSSILGSNTFWCWKAVLNHCKVGEVAKNRTRTICSLLQQQPEQSVLTERGKEEGAKTREEKVSASCSSERPPLRWSQSAGMSWGRKSGCEVSALGTGICQEGESWSFFYNSASPLKRGFLQVSGIMQAPLGEEKVVGSNVSHTGEARARPSTAAAVSEGSCEGGAVLAVRAGSSALASPWSQTESSYDFSLCGIVS